MATALLIRHGRSTANTAGTLAGWMPDVHLDAVGLEQVSALGSRLAPLSLTAVVSSPLERCLETTAAVVGGRDIVVHEDRDLAEVRYGAWTGQPLKSLAKDPLWKVVQQHPSNATFPGDEAESLADMQARAVRAVRGWNARLGDKAVYAVVSHGDVIKAILADALGLHLDLFQRIIVDPASLSVVQYTDTRPFVERMNDTGGEVAGLLPRKGRRSRSRAGDAAIGGGSGPGKPKGSAR